MVDVIYKRKNGRLGQSVSFHDADGKPYEKPLTDQSFKDETDINIIIDRFKRAGTVPAAAASDLHYIDFTEVTNFQDAMIKVFEAEDMFNTIDAKIRYRFDNDPGKFLAFIDDPNNAEELVKMGLAIAKPNDLGGTTTPVSDVSQPEQ